MKKLKHINWLTALLVITLFTACQKENRCDCFKKTGTIDVSKREVAPFDQIVVENNLNVFITQDTVYEVKVEAGINLIPLIKTEVIDGTLYIRNKNKCNWARNYDQPFNIYVKMPVIKYITAAGTGTIKSLNTITTPEFDVAIQNSGDVDLKINNLKLTSHVHGSGDLILSGTTGEHACDIGGTSFLKCQDLQTVNSWVHSYTTGLCYVKASNEITTIIDDVGDIYCYENPPTVLVTKNGKGQLYLKQ